MSAVISLSAILISLLLTACSSSTGSTPSTTEDNEGDTTTPTIPSFTYNKTRDFIVPAYGATLPAKGESRIDPVTGVKITRLTDASELPGTADALIVYSRYSPENTAGDMFLTFGANSSSSWVIERVTGNIVAALTYDDVSTHTAGEVQEVRWDLSGDHPYRVYYRQGMKLYQIDDVRNQAATRSVIKDFDTVSSIPAAATYLYNDVEGDSSNDSDHWAFMAANYDGSNYVVHAFVHYQISTDTTHVMVPSDLAGHPNLAMESGFTTFGRRPNMVEMSPNGAGVVIHYGRAWDNSAYPALFQLAPYIGSEFDGPHLWPVDFNWSSSTPVKISVDESHSGWAFDDAGNEYFISQNNRTDKLDSIKVTGANSGYDNRVQFADHADFGWSNGFHYGKMSATCPGWAFVNTYSNISHGSHSADWAADQLFMIETKAEGSNPIILRIGSNYNEYAGNYRDEAPAAINTTCERIYVSNNWGGNMGHREVFLYEIPNNWTTGILTP